MRDDLIQHDNYLERNMNTELQWHYCSNFVLKQYWQLESQPIHKFPFELYDFFFISMVFVILSVRVAGLEQFETITINILKPK